MPIERNVVNYHNLYLHYNWNTVLNLFLASFTLDFLKSSLSKTFSLLNFWLNCWPLLSNMSGRDQAQSEVSCLYLSVLPATENFSPFFKIWNILKNLTFTKFRGPKLDHKNVFIFFSMHIIYKKHPNHPFLNSWYSVRKITPSKRENVT